MAELRSVTCHMGSHSVICRLHPALIPDRLVLDLPTFKGWKAELTLASVIY